MAAGGGSAGIASGLIVGGFLCLGLFLLAIAATVVLSLIGIYTSNSSQNTWGEEYQSTLLMKVIYANTTYTFANGTVADSTTMSTLCGTMYRKTSSVKSFAACIMTNFYASGNTSYNDSTTAKRRRRANVGVGTYGLGMAGTGRYFYSRRCLGTATKGSYANSSSLNSCIKQRIAECNKLFNSTGTLTSWTPLPNSFALSIVESKLSGYIPLSVSNLLSFPTSLGAIIAALLGFSPQTISEIASGCRYIGPISQADIATAVALQGTATTSAPTSVAIG